MSELDRIREIKNWTEVSRGYYRYVIATKVAYELLCYYADGKSNIYGAYIAGYWQNEQNENFFAREIIVEECTLDECLDAVVRDYCK